MSKLTRPWTSAPRDRATHPVISDFSYGRQRRRTLQIEKHGRANNRDEVEGQVHDVSNDGRRAELGKGVFYCLSKPLDGITSGLDLATLTDHVDGISRDEGAIERVKNGLLQEPVPRDHIRNGRAFIQHKKNC